MRASASTSSNALKWFYKLSKFQSEVTCSFAWCNTLQIFTSLLWITIWLVLLQFRTGRCDDAYTPLSRAETWMVKMLWFAYIQSEE